MAARLSACTTRCTRKVEDLRAPVSTRARSACTSAATPSTSDAHIGHGRAMMVFDMVVRHLRFRGWRRDASCATSPTWTTRSSPAAAESAARIRWRCPSPLRGATTAEDMAANSGLLVEPGRGAQGQHPHRWIASSTWWASWVDSGPRLRRTRAPCGSAVDVQGRLRQALGPEGRGAALRRCGRRQEATPPTSPCGKAAQARRAQRGRARGVAGRPGWHIECSAMSSEAPR